jgi:hypothetical protein
MPFRRRGFEPTHIYAPVGRHGKVWFAASGRRRCFDFGYDRSDRIGCTKKHSRGRKNNESTGNFDHGYGVYGAPAAGGKVLQSSDEEFRKSSVSVIPEALTASLNPVISSRGVKKSGLHIEFARF